MLSHQNRAKPANEAYAAFAETKKVLDSQLLSFSGLNGYDIYNPSVPFDLEGTTWIAGRVEERVGHASRVMFFEKTGANCRLREDMPVFEMEDPFVSFIGGELVLGGVVVEWEGITPVSIKTVFYRGKTLTNLTLFAQGPRNMRDIRLVELPDGRIGVFTRPRDFSKLEEWGSLAKIGYATIDSMEELTAEAIDRAKLLDGHFTGLEWGGANHAFMLKNGLVGVVGHRAWGTFKTLEDCDLHYYGIAFALDPATGATTPTKIIISRDCFPPAPAKNPGLVDVTFTAGIKRGGDGTASVYSGLSDAAVGVAVIPDPFAEWEALDRKG